MAEGGCNSFKCIKITLIVLYVLSIVFVVIALIGSIAAYASNDSKKSETKEDKKVDFIWLIVILSLSLLFNLIGLIGIIKEHFCIVVTITVVSALTCLGYILSGQLITGILSLLITILIGYYAHLIRLKNKPNTTA